MFIVIVALALVAFGFTVGVLRLRIAWDLPQHLDPLVMSPDGGLILTNELVDKLFEAAGYDTTALLGEGCVIVDCGRVVRVPPDLKSKTISVGRRSITRREIREKMRDYRTVIIVRNDLIIEERLRALMRDASKPTCRN